MTFSTLPKNATKIQLSEGFESFPEELFTYKETLEILDLSRNKLSELPSNFNEFKNLKIAFFSENDFEVFPEILGKCPSLTMIGFKSNSINYISENALPKNLQWLILTDNQIECLPDSIGSCLYLQKCALAGNKLISLPVSMSNCLKLELLRVSANKMTNIPFWLLELPRLAWLAIDGNPCSKNRKIDQLNLDEIDYNTLLIQKKIGEGASGFIHIAKSIISNKLFALKTFKGEVTSDGYPIDELENSLLAGRHENIVPLLGPFINHPESKSGIVMDLIPSNYSTLGFPPSLESCTRDVFEESMKLSSELVYKIACSVANAALHLHSNGVMHGDLYAHNILYDLTTGHAFLGDFGASTHYEIKSETAKYFERLDVRAYGYLLDDLIRLSMDYSKHVSVLEEIRLLSLGENVLERPSFKEIVSILEST